MKYGPIRKIKSLSSADSKTNTKKPLPTKWLRISSETRGFQFLCTHPSIALGEGHRPLNWPMSPLSARFNVDRQILLAGSSTEGMSTFLTNLLDVPPFSYRWKQSTFWKLLDREGERAEEPLQDPFRPESQETYRNSKAPKETHTNPPFTAKLQTKSKLRILWQLHSTGNPYMHYSIENLQSSNEQD